jgi:hypothetical protein
MTELVISTLAEFTNIQKSMGAILEALDMEELKPLKEKPIVAAGLKRMSRAKILHAVLTEKQPDIKIDDINKMGLEWLHGMLDVTFTLEQPLVDTGFGDEELFENLLMALDAGDSWVRKMASVFEEAGRIKQPLAKPECVLS